MITEIALNLSRLHCHRAKIAICILVWKVMKISKFCWLNWSKPCQISAFNLVTTRFNITIQTNFRDDISNKKLWLKWWIFKLEPLYLLKFNSNVFLVFHWLFNRALSVFGKKIWFSTIIGFQIDFITHTLLLWAWHHMKFMYTLKWFTSLRLSAVTLTKL